VNLVGHMIDSISGALPVGVIVVIVRVAPALAP